MIYRSINDLPVVLYYEILKTGNVSLLSTEKVKSDELLELWQKIKDDFNERDNSQLNNKILTILKHYEYYILKYDVVNRICESLKFSFNQELIDLLDSMGYKINPEKYIEDIERIKKNAEGLLVKANHFKAQLPKETDNDKDEFNIEDVLASFSNVLGFHIGRYNEITCTEYFALKKQVSNKIKQQEKQIRELKTHKNRNV